MWKDERRLALTEHTKKEGGLGRRVRSRERSAHHSRHRSGDGARRGQESTQPTKGHAGKEGESSTGNRQLVAKQAATAQAQAGA